MGDQAGSRTHILHLDQGSRSQPAHLTPVLVTILVREDHRRPREGGCQAESERPVLSMTSHVILVLKDLPGVQGWETGNTSH